MTRPHNIYGTSNIYPHHFCISNQLLFVESWNFHICHGDIYLVQYYAHVCSFVACDYDLKQIYDLPDFKLAFLVRNFPMGQKVLMDSIQMTDPGSKTG